MSRLTANNHIKVLKSEQTLRKAVQAPYIFPSIIMYIDTLIDARKLYFHQDMMYDRINPDRSFSNV